VEIVLLGAFITVLFVLPAVVTVLYAVSKRQEPRGFDVVQDEDHNLP